MAKILIVDDAKINRMILLQFLKDRYEVLQAEDGLEAIEVFRGNEKQIKAVILDAVMPVSSGYDFLAAARKHGWLDHTPVIMVSTDCGEASVRKAFEEGATDFIRRPVDCRTVQRKVEAAIERFHKGM